MQHQLSHFFFCQSEFLPSPSKRVMLCEQHFLHLFKSCGLPAPPTKLMPSSTVFDAKGRPQLDVIRPHLIAEGRLTEEAILRIISETSAILRSEKTMLDLEAPITGFCCGLPIINSGVMSYTQRCFPTEKATYYRRLLA
ncbi:Serine/threonine-protein phosphatase [Fasciolopsis buskii]|uniref:Serine/threonine-protein phosphatase n=1 Tax=Fasciolopsis buskii TaxID=27845 RepID=A0A8E0VFD7_9TREM|nr:Serine/threonine-protein phosphatase [Fasciolopsis buski]